MKNDKILAEESPNPHALRISFGRDLLSAPGWLEYHSPESAVNSPLASRLFFFRFMKSVFIDKDYFTILKDPEYDWEHIIMEIREAIDRYLDTNLPVSYDTPIVETVRDEQAQEVWNVLNGSIRGATGTDGGALTFVSLEDGVLTVMPRGACLGCPHITETISKGLEPAFKKHFTYVHSVKCADISASHTT
jgi:NFU1 iron-sulfur cluster scaffold homolog, mitochondrial